MVTTGWTKIAWFWLILSGTLAGEEPDLKSTYKEQVEKWRLDHEAKFRSPNGWLALVGHFWLEQGTNAFGSSTDCHIQLPKIAGQESGGSFLLTGDKVKLIVEKGSVTLNQKSTTESALNIDASEPETDGKDDIRVGDRIKLQLVRRNNRFAVRVRDSQSELIQSFKGKEWFPIDPNYRVEAKFNRLAIPRTIKIINVKGDQTDTKIVGTVNFKIGQTECQLDAMADAPDQLFLIFKDLTNGKSTYGAGRFLDVPVLPNTDSIVLDFNQSYNPPCAFSPHTLCPVPPLQNHLKIAIAAGERYTPNAK